MNKKDMEKATAAVEEIFAHAVALTQANRLKNTVYCKENHVFILNFDNTILLRFTLPEWHTPFSNPVAFNANDYDGNHFYEKDGKIIFVSEVGGVERKKTIAVPGAAPDEIERMFKNYETLNVCDISFHKNILEALDDKLSHIEISVRDGEWKLIQRDIYSGSTIEISELKKGLRAGGNIKQDIGPVGIRTNDFAALFTFNDRVKFHFDPDCREYASVTGQKYDMEGTVAFCIYDEIGDITPTKNKSCKKQEDSDGSEEPKGRFREGRKRGVTGRNRKINSEESEERPKPQRGRRRRK